MNKYIVGVHCPEFCDQSYIRDRDLQIEAESEKEAVIKWLEIMKHWIRTDEIHLVKVLKKL